MHIRRHFYNWSRGNSIRAIAMRGWLTIWMEEKGRVVSEREQEMAAYDGKFCFLFFMLLINFPFFICCFCCFFFFLLFRCKIEVWENAVAGANISGVQIYVFWF